MSSDTLQPLEGEQTIPSVVPVKPKANYNRPLIAGAVMVTVAGMIGTGAYMYFRKPPELTTPAPAQDTGQPAVATPGSINMTTLAPADGASAPAPGASGTVVPSIAINDADGPLTGQPIPVQGHGAGGTGTAGKAGGQTAQRDPVDAPIFPADTGPEIKANRMASADPRASSGSYDTPSTGDSRPTAGNQTSEARASLEAYKKQLGGIMESLQQRINGQPVRTPAAASLGAADSSPLSQAVATAAGRSPLAGGAGTANSGGGILGMDRSATGHVRAEFLGDRSMIVPKGTLFLCSLKTKVVTATSGFIGCQVSRNVYSDDRKVLLIERGAHLDGEYRIVQVRPGLTRVPVIWTRLRSQGVTVPLDSPATGELGESGLGGYVDNRWGERLGAALMLSLIQDAIQYETEKASNSGNDSSSSSSTQPVVLANTTGQSSKLAEQVLATTINIPPLLYANQGGMAGVYVAHDLDFSSVYELRPVELAHDASR